MDGVKCLACPAGTYNEFPDMTNVSDCIACSTNSVSPQGSSNRTNCMCNIGYTSSGPGLCIACVRGTYKDIAGTAACTLCPFESLSPDAATNLNNCTCNPGYTGPDGSSCEACPAGFYKDVAGHFNCTQCPTFSSSPPGSRNLSMCACSPGYTGPLGGPCEECPEDTYKELVRIPSCCSPARADEAVGICAESFLNGFRARTWQSGNASCSFCPDDSFSRNASSLLTNCSCAAGYTSRLYPHSNRYL